MFSRKNSDKEGMPVPTEWKEEFIAVLLETFKDQLPSDFHTFDAFGEIFENELLVVSCLYDSKNLNSVPVSCFISVDMDDKIKKDPKKTLNDMMDLTGLFFEEYFQDENFSDFEPNWQENTFRKQQYFFKITRENIPLTIEANKLLQDDIKKH